MVPMIGQPPQTGGPMIGQPPQTGGPMIGQPPQGYLPGTGGPMIGQPPQTGGPMIGQPPQTGGPMIGQPPQTGGPMIGQPPQTGGMPGTGGPMIGQPPQGGPMIGQPPQGGPMIGQPPQGGPMIGQPPQGGMPSPSSAGGGMPPVAGGGMPQSFAAGGGTPTPHSTTGRPQQTGQPLMSGYAQGGGTPSPSAQGGGTPSLQNTVSNAYNGAVSGTMQALMMNLGMTPRLAGTRQAGAPGATAQGYQAFTGLGIDGFGFNPATGGGYTAAQMGPIDHITARQFAGMDMDPYMNPYLDNVVNQTQSDMERSRLVQQNQADDAMMKAGAFGGSRHGIANAETNRNYYDRLGATLGGLRHQGYESAKDSAFRDIDNTMRADLANQQMDFNVGSFNTGQTNDARRTGANNAMQASIANAQMQNNLTGQRLGYMNDARRFGADAANRTSMFNSQLGADLSRFNAGQYNQNSQFNANAYNNFGQNQFNNQMNASSQLGNLSNLGFGMYNTMSGQQAQDGAQQQAIQQALINAARQQFAGYTGAGNLGLGMLQSGVQSAPGAQNTTQSSNPGLLGFLAPFL